MKKRLFAVLMSLTLIFTYMPLMAYADGEEALTNDTEVTEAVQNAEESSDAATEAETEPESETEPEAAPATTAENSTGEDEAEAPAPQKAEASEDQAKRAEVMQSEESVLELYSEEEKQAIFDSAGSYNVGSPLEVTVPANSTVAYEVEGTDYYGSPICFYLENKSDNGGGIIEVSVVDKYGDVKAPLTAYEAYYGQIYGFSIAGEGIGSSFYLEDGFYRTEFYNIEYGDYIVFSSMDRGSVMSMLAQEIVAPSGYLYGEYKDLHYGYLGRQAQLKPIYTMPGFISDAVLYVENMSDTYDFSYCLLTSSGEVVCEREGDDWIDIEPGWYYDSAYQLDDEDYYLLIFNTPGQRISDYDNYNYDQYDVEEDIADFALCVSPRNIKYYSVSGITSRTYTGKALTQRIDVKYGDILLLDDECKVSYSNNKNVGLATVTISGKAPYTGTIKRTFKINPKGTSISKLTRAKKAFTVKWKKQTSKMSTSRINSYQVQYSTKKNFSSAKIKTITGYKKYSKKITGLKRKTTYYVRVRTCKKVNGKWYYSAWSAAKKVKTK